MEKEIKTLFKKDYPSVGDRNIDDLTKGFKEFLLVVDSMGIGLNDLRDMVVKHKEEQRFNEDIKEEEIYKRLRDTFVGTAVFTVALFLFFIAIHFKDTDLYEIVEEIYHGKWN